MAKLRTTLIDVGWGDSLLLECSDDNGNDHYALIDSNDSSYLRASHIFLKKFFERKNVSFPTDELLFDWVLLSHVHADHAEGLKRILRDFGTKMFWYPDSRHKPAYFADLLRYANRSKRVSHHEFIDDGKLPPSFGAASMEVLWPPPRLRPTNENDNSVVLAITLKDVCFVLTGDAEADGVWTTLASKIPSNTCFFKVPHHGAENGTFTSTGTTPWLNVLPAGARVAISSHVRPFSHPDKPVIDELAKRGDAYRTDQHYHITVETEGDENDLRVIYSHP
jgi:beta-lactamase superfamily II metal-dependent hydrolase